MKERKKRKVMKRKQENMSSLSRKMHAVCSTFCLFFSAKIGNQLLSSKKANKQGTT